jgi:hypothetical protein
LINPLVGKLGPAKVKEVIHLGREGKTVMSLDSLRVKIPEVLHEPLQNYLESHPEWDQERVLAAALSMFLLQNSDTDTTRCYQQTAKVYLEALFQNP